MDNNQAQPGLAKDTRSDSRTASGCLLIGLTSLLTFGFVAQNEERPAHVQFDNVGLVDEPDLWGSIDRPVGTITVKKHRCEDLDAGYRASPGQPPLHADRDHCRAPTPKGSAETPLTAIEMDAVEWAHGQFRAAGLDLPAMEIAFSVNIDDCDGAQGIYRGRSGTHSVTVCVPDAQGAGIDLRRRRTLLHEFAHVWDHATLTDVDRERLLPVLEAADWHDPDAAWDQRGVERLAETVTWGLLDQVRRPLKIDTQCATVHANFITITGSKALGPLEGICEIDQAASTPHAEHLNSVVRSLDISDRGSSSRAGRTPRSPSPLPTATGGHARACPTRWPTTSVEPPLGSSPQMACRSSATSSSSWQAAARPPEARLYDRSPYTHDDGAHPDTVASNLLAARTLGTITGSEVDVLELTAAPGGGPSGGISRAIVYLNVISDGAFTATSVSRRPVGWGATATSARSITST